MNQTRGIKQDQTTTGAHHSRYFVTVRNALPLLLPSFSAILFFCLSQKQLP